MAFKDILQFGIVRKRYKRRIPTRVSPLLKKHCPHRPARISFENREEKKALIDVRKEKCICVCIGPVLAPQPQMVAPSKALPARPNIRIPKIVSQFHGLVHPTVTVSQVGRLRCPQVGSKTFLCTRPISAGYVTLCKHIHLQQLTIRVRLQSAQSRRLRGPTQSSVPR